MTMSSAVRQPASGVIVEMTLRVTSIRSQNPRGFGGAIFAAKPIDANGDVVDAATYWVVRASGNVISGVPVQTGQWWKVVGTPSSRVQDIDGYRITETQVDATEALLLRPSGEHIVGFLADNPEFKGIGRVKARRIWDGLGDKIYDVLDNGDVATLSGFLSKESAEQVIVSWAKHGDSRTLQWLQAQGFDLALGKKVLEFFGAETAEKLEADPYRLLSFCASWRQVDQLARTHFGIADDDQRRLQGAIEEACYRIFSAGHTTTLSAALMAQVAVLLGPQTTALPWRALVTAALAQGLDNGSFVVSHHGVQPLGALVMESEVAKAMADRIASKSEELLPKDEVDEVLLEFERAEGKELNAEQWAAVHLGASRPIVIISGGAGVGKTTVLKALYAVYDKAGIGVTQLALAGRAAKRMHEATGRPASTIANFIYNWKPGTFDGQCAVVVDEASMVDIITMSRLCELLDPSVRLVLVGDTGQLMPVGPGLVLHALAKVQQMPIAELKVVRRFGGEIAAAASLIRGGQWPELSVDPKAAIAFIECRLLPGTNNEESISETVLHLYRQDPANTQILCARRNSPDGTKPLNALCQAAMTSDAEPLRVWSAEHDAFAHTGIHLGDTLMCTRNMWDRGLQNGSLGEVVQIEREPRLLIDDNGEEEGHALAWVEWDDGVRRPIVEEMLDDLELGYAITVHKAQGSQWPRVIVPLTKNRMLDRTLIYTAVTRAQGQVVLVGDPAAAKSAVEREPHVNKRQVALDLLLRAQLGSS